MTPADRRPDAGLPPADACWPALAGSTLAAWTLAGRSLAARSLGPIPCSVGRVMSAPSVLVRISAVAKHMMPSPRPIAPSCSARLPLIDTGAPTAALSSVLHLARAGASFGRSHTTAQSMLTTAHASSAEQRHDVAQHRDRVGARPPWIGVGEVLADVAEPGRTEQGVGAGVGDHVGVAVAARGRARPRTRRRRAPAPGRVVGEAVDVEALTDPDVGNGSLIRASPPASARRAQSRSSGSVIFRLRRSPATTTTRPPNASTSAASSVAEPACPCAARSAADRNACGVCTATKSTGRVSRRPTRCRRCRRRRFARSTLIVSVTAIAGMAASAPSRTAAITRS